MKFNDILNMPTTGDLKGKTHESVFRSYHILLKVREFLEIGMPTPTLLELIDFMREWRADETKEKP